MVIKTNRDKNGNYTGKYKGVNFIIYGFPEGWVFNIIYYCKLMCQDSTYDSRDSGEYAFSTKKRCLQILKETIDNNKYK